MKTMQETNSTRNKQQQQQYNTLDPKESIRSKEVKQKGGMSPSGTGFPQDSTKDSNKNEANAPQRKEWIYDDDFERWIHSLPKVIKLDMFVTKDSSYF